MLKKILRLIKKKSLSEIHNYWRNPDNYNDPVKYLNNEDTIERSEYLYKIISNHFDSSIKILELGSNVGRNLNYLYERGFKNLTGIEINENAIILMVKNYPDCYNNIKILPGEVEKYIKGFKTKEFDLIFTMAVLEHIHDDSKWIFNEIMRITKNILTIEDEKSLSYRHFPRNYKKIFGRQMRQIYYEDCSFIKGFNKGFKARLFTH